MIQFYPDFQTHSIKFSLIISKQVVYHSNGSLNFFSPLNLKAQRKKMQLKLSSAEVVCCKYLPSITGELSIEANSVDPEQTAPIGAV